MASIRQLYVTLSLRADEYNNKLRAAQKETREFNATISPVTKALKDVGQAATAAGSVLTAGLTAPIVAIGALSIKSAKDFESSFAGVRKTVDGVVDQAGNLTAAGKQMSDGLRQMAKEIPVNVNELNKIAEAAGQLGIRKEDILKFTRVMADLSVTTNLTSDQAATAIAKIQNIFGAAGKDTDRFASTLVALGNAGASTEKDIVEMSMRIAGAGKSIGITQGEVLAFASTLSSVGINAEAGGSAISRIFLKMKDAVAGGGAALDEFARVAGMNSAAFKKAFQEDAAGATVAFVDGLKRLEKGGENINATMEGMVGKNIILKDTLNRLVGSGDLLINNLKLQKEAWESNSALTKEAEERYKTFDSRLKVFWQRIEDVRITLGQALIPVFVRLLDTLTPLITGIAKAADWFQKLPEPAQTAAVAIAAVAAAVGPLLIVLGSLVSGITTLIPQMTSLAATMKSLSIASTVSTAIQGLGQSMGALQLLMSARSIADFSAGISLLGSTSLLAKAGLVGLAAGVGIAIGSLINMGIEALGLTGKLDSLLKKSIELIPVFGKWATGQAAADKAAKSTEAGIYQMQVAAADLGITIERGTMTQQQYTDALGKAVREYYKAQPAAQQLSKSTKDVSDAADKATGGTEKLTKAQKEAAAEAKKAADEWEKQKNAFNDSLAPADALTEKLAALQKEFGNTKLIKVHGDEIITAVEKQKKLGPELDANAKLLYALALGAKAATRELELMQAPILDMLSPLHKVTIENEELWESMTKIGQELPKSSNAMAELGRKSIEAGEQIRKTEENVARLSKEGIHGSVIIEGYGSEIERAKKNAEEFNIPLGETTAGILRQADAATVAQARIKEFQNTFISAFTGIVDGLVNMISQFKFSLDSLGDLAKNAASQMLKAFTDALFSPIRDAITNLGKSLAGSLANALSGSLGGLTGKIPGLGSLLGGAAPAVAGGFLPVFGGASSAAAAAGTGTAAAGGTAAGGAGLTATLTGLATNPITIAAAGAIVAALLAKKLVGQGRETADIFVNEVQSAFSTTGDQWFKGLQNIIDPITRARESGTLTAEMVQTAIADLEKDWDTFNKIAQSFIDAKAGVGGKEQLVVDQAFATLNPIMDRFREDLSSDLVKLKQAAEEQAESAQSAADDVSDATDKMGTSVRDGFKVFDKAVDKFMEAVMKFAASGVSAIKSAVDTAKATVSTAVNTVAPTTEQTANVSSVIGDITGRVRTVDQALADMANTIAESSGNWQFQSRMANTGLTEAAVQKPEPQQIIFAPVIHYTEGDHDIRMSNDADEFNRMLKDNTANNRDQVLDILTKLILENKTALSNSHA